MGIKEWISKEKFGIVFVIALILIVGFVYFNTEGATSMGGPAISDSSALKEVVLKLSFNDLNQPKIFALAENNALAEYKTMEGNPIPENNSMVIGSIEAEMMKKENLFSKAGDKINGLFGINPTIEGVLKETGTVMDYFHFLSAEEFKQLNGEENKVYIKFEENDASLFITYDSNKSLSLIKLKEGSISNYEEHTIVGKKYYPILLGSTQAEMMKKENEFKTIGDLVEEFGQKFIVIGIMDTTNSAFDLAHIVPLNANQWDEVGQ